ncbi:uncharacterized protein LOC131056238 [Cryptomeria japonica]|uniref:uncharacterized protein LOC131056238 n=1 Tax=Cryptomeria japonica TaxID=3369 RepID=UPI0025AC1120|nr:uncharacterized protein LOC131056238 [Cryptomeria japonica]
MSKLVKLKELTIYDCNKLEELPNLAHQSFLKKITITECRTLKSIALPTKLVMLSISECHDLKELSLGRLSCLETVTINRCEKLQDIAGIEELQRLKHMQLSIGTNVAVRNCIHRLQRLPSEFMTASRKAGHGADSNLEGHFFSDLKGTGAVSKIPMEKDGSGFVKASLDSLEIMPESGSLSAIILCVVVLVEVCCEDSVYIGLCRHGAMESWIFEEVQIDRGEWIITMVITDQELIAGYIKDRKLGTVEITLDEPRGIKKGWILPVNKGEEWRILRVLNTIVELDNK